MTVEILGPVVAVLRQCRICGQWKALEHYYLRDKRARVIDDTKVCAGCRVRGKKAS